MSEIIKRRQVKSLDVREVCGKYGLPEQVVEMLKKFKVGKLYPPQEDAIKKGALEGKNLVLSVPTASGKTLVSEFCMLKSVLKEGGKCLYIVPLRALASEKYEEFKQKYEPLGIKVGISTGDFDIADPRLARYDILIATSEKVDSLLRHRAKWLADVISVAVLDEVHLINDPGRGPTLEILTARLRQVNPRMQIIALSATIRNSEEIAEWLEAELIKSDWRPVPLKKGVYHNERIKFDDGGKRRVGVKGVDALAALTLDTVEEGGQALVFVNTRRSAQAAADLIAKHIRRLLTGKERENILEVAKRVESALGESTRTCRLLAECVRKGVAFHHAGLHHTQRKAVEDAFRQNLIKVICATPTLCLVPGTKLITAGNPTMKSIEQLRVGEQVFTHTAQFKNVLQPVKHLYGGEVITIYPYYQLPVTMTPEHKVLLSRRRRRSIHHQSGKSVHWFEYESPAWIEAKFLKKGDLVLFPRLKEEYDVECIHLPEHGIETGDGKFTSANQFARFPTKHPNYHVIPSKLPLTEDLLWLIGCYIAEGTASKGFAAFCIGAHENHLTKTITKKIENVFGIRASIKNRGSKRKIIVCSRILAKLFPALCGAYAYEKHIPPRFLFLPRNKLVPLVAGLWAGDGCYTESKGACAARYHTRSEILAHQIYILLAKLGYIPSMRRYKQSSNASFGKPGTPMYCIAVSGQQLEKFCREMLGIKRKYQGNRTYNLAHIDEHYLFLPIRKIEKSSYTGPVYNLEVEDDSSYVGPFAVHNSAGVNLPSRRVIIRDYRRYVAPFGLEFIPVLEFHQFCGRAGRPQYDKYGEAVLIAKDKGEIEALFEEFIRAEPERITSKLATEPALRTHVLASIAAGYVNSFDGILEFMKHTFFAYQWGVSEVENIIERVLDFLEREQMIKRQGKLLGPTPFGELVSRLYIDPLSAVVLRDGIKGISRERPTDLGLLHLICHTPDMTLLYLGRRDPSEFEALVAEHTGEFLVKVPDPMDEPEVYEYFLAEVKTACMLQSWLDEEIEDRIHERFGVGAGDIRRSVDTAEWLLYASHELARLFKIRPALAPLRKLRERVRYGIKEELLELVQLRGIGRVRGRSLFRAGYRKLADIKRATEQELARVPYIGVEIARGIKRQVERSIDDEKLPTV